MKKIVIALSGGIDSTTVLAMELEKALEREVHCICFRYPSKHNTQEVNASYNVYCHYRLMGFNIFWTCVDVTSVFDSFKSALLIGTSKVPEAHYQDASQKLTIVPGRNTIFAAILMGYAQNIGANKIYLGMHKGDSFIYPDCREEWAIAMEDVIDFATEGKVGLKTPLIDYTKREIVRDGLFMGAPFNLTWTCYKGELTPCGVCGACVERREAFELNDVRDPAWKPTI